MPLEYQQEAHSEEVMVHLGEQFGNALNYSASETETQVCATVFFQGDLGMGKTTFTRGIMSYFGHKGATKSPTYTLVEPYQFNEQNLNHFDLYRLGHPEELDYLGIRDYFDGRSINLVEWPDKGRGFLPTADITIEISPLERGRSLRFIGNSVIGEAIIDALKQERK